MTPIERFGMRIERALSARERLLVIYITLCDPITSITPEFIRSIVAAGADILELGLPTPRTNPRGGEIRDSFKRAEIAGPAPDFWSIARVIRSVAPDVLLTPLVYRETIEDLGIDNLVRDASSSGMDGLILADTVPRSIVKSIVDSGLCVIPVIRSDLSEAQIASLEENATHLTYRTLSPKTGISFDLDGARKTLLHLATNARKPFIVGFGIRDICEIRELSPYAAGFVIGSEFIRRLRLEPVEHRQETAFHCIAEWKAATISDAMLK